MDKIKASDICVYDEGTQERDRLEVVAACMNAFCPVNFWGQNFTVDDIWFDYGAGIMRTTISYCMKKDGEPVQALMPNEQADMMNAETVGEMTALVKSYFADRIKKGYTV